MSNIIFGTHSFKHTCERYGNRYYKCVNCNLVTYKISDESKFLYISRTNNLTSNTCNTITCNEFIMKNIL